MLGQDSDPTVHQGAIRGTGASRRMWTGRIFAAGSHIAAGLLRTRGRRCDGERASIGGKPERGGCCKPPGEQHGDGENNRQPRNPPDSGHHRKQLDRPTLLSGRGAGASAKHAASLFRHVPSSRNITLTWINSMSAGTGFRLLCSSPSCCGPRVIATAAAPSHAVFASCPKHRVTPAFARVGKEESM